MNEPWGYSLVLVSSFNSKQNKHYFYRGKNCIKRFCRDLKELATKIINYDEKEMIPLTDNGNRSSEKQNKRHICQNVTDHCHYTEKFGGAAHSICSLRYKVP